MCVPAPSSANPLEINAQQIGVITGNVLMNGRKIGRDCASLSILPERWGSGGRTVQRGTAYAEQLDEHEFTATCREAMRFSAYLRQPAHVSKEEKDRYVEEVIQLLEMEDIADVRTSPLI
jgi:ABC-type multidrug transport system ATPase subunit